MKQVRPMFKRYLVFSVPVRRRIEGSLLYRPNGNRYSFSRAEEIWIISKGHECKLDLKPGDHCWLNDSFELDSSGLDLWDDMKDDPKFLKLKEFVDKVDGVVKTQIVTEDAILAIDEDYEGSTVIKQMPLD